MTGTVHGWGDNGNGQLANDQGTWQSNPTEVKGLEGVRSLASGSGHTLVVLDDGSVLGWGRNAFGQCGDPATPNQFAPVEMLGLSEITMVAPGGGHSIVLRADGMVLGWGAGFFGMLGPGTLGVQPEPTPIDGLDGQVVKVVAGGAHNLVLMDDGTVWTWGRDDRGQLGDGGADRPGQATREYRDRTYPIRPIPARVEGLSDVRDVAAGGGHCLALLSDGTLASWGFDDRGQLGDGGDTNRSAPGPVERLRGVSAMAAGYHHSVALLDDGTVWAWGLNDGGQCGDGTTEHRSTPVRVAGLSDVKAIAANGGGPDVAPGNAGHNVAVLGDGTVWTWGYNDYGECGDGTVVNRHVPVQVPGLTGVRDVAAGGEIPFFRENPGGGYSFALGGEAA